MARGFFQTGQTRRLDEALTLGALPSKFASAAHSFGLLASLLLRWLFEIGARLHFTEQAFTLHLLLQRAQGLFDIIVANGNLNNGQLSIKSGQDRPASVRLWPIGAETSRAYNMWIPPCLSPESDMDTPSDKLRDRWLDALLPEVSKTGWTVGAMRRSAAELGLTAGETALAAPNGITDLIDHFFARAADQMHETLAAQELDAMRTHDRVAAGLLAWLQALDPDKAAVRKAAGRGLLPWGAGAAIKRVWSIADTIWDAAGDTATDYNRQTKRALLSAVIPPIILHWLHNDDRDKLETFIQRRLQRAMKVGQAGGKILGPILDFAEEIRVRRKPREL